MQHPIDPRESDRRTIAAQLDQFASLTRGVEDTVRYLTGFADDAILLPADGAAVIGLPAVQAYYEKLLESVVAVSVRYDEVVVEMEATLAVRRYSGTAAVTYTGADTPSVLSTRYIDLLRQDADRQWKIIVHTWINNGEALMSNAR